MFIYDSKWSTEYIAGKKRKYIATVCAATSKISVAENLVKINEFFSTYFTS